MIVAQRLTKSMRLRRRREFVAIQAGPQGSTKIVTRHLIALIAPNSRSSTTIEAKDEITGLSLPLGRVGLTVSKRVGNAPVRNRVRRFIREWLRTHGWISAPADVVLIAKDSAATLRHRDDFAIDLGKIQHHVGRTIVAA